MKKICFLLLLFLSACASEPSKKNLERGRAQIVSTMGEENVSGTVDFVETPKGLEVVVDVEGLPPGKHGFHIHEYGDLSDQGKAAGSHYNPNQTKHGFIVTDGYQEAHAGDFGNLEIDQEGKGQLRLIIPEMTLNGGKYNIAGRAVIIHESEDDFGQPLGNAGGRIAGGLILIVK